MKQFFALIVVAIVAFTAGADTYNYLNFVKSDAVSGNSFGTTGLKITFSGTNANVTADGQTTTLAMSNFGYLEFSNTKLDGSPSWLKGDVNGDGVVDVADINCLVNIILGNASASDFGGRANVNGDDAVDVSDINAIISILIGV